MTISTSWSVQIGTLGSFTQFVGRVRGMTISTQLERGQMGSANVIITFDNDDGALTPNAGGTYSGVDWFSQLVLVDCTITDGTSSDTVPVFHGSVADFRVDDNGVNSTVTLQGIDIFQIIGRAPVGSNASASVNLIGPSTAMLRALNGGGPSSVDPVEAPLFGSIQTDFGARLATPSVTQAGLSSTDCYYQIQHAGIAAGQIINTQILPSGPHYAWPADIDEIFSGTRWRVMFYIATSSLNRFLPGSPDTGKYRARSYVFKANPTGTELPRNTVVAGWDIDDVRNEAEVDSWANDPKVIKSASSDSSAQTYGLSGVAVLESAAQTADEQQRTANRWATQYDKPWYVARTMTVRESTVISKCDDAAYQSYADLLDVRSGLWNTAAVTYTPTGAASAVTDNTLIFGRVIRVNPSDTEITLSLVPASNYQSFQLDSSVIGVLDQNRLG